MVEISEERRETIERRMEIMKQISVLNVEIDKAKKACDRLFQDITVELQEKRAEYVAALELNGLTLGVLR